MPVVLPDAIQERVRDFPETHGGVNTITVTLRDGRLRRRRGGMATEVIRASGHATIPFTAEEIADVDDASGLA